MLRRRRNRNPRVAPEVLAQQGAAEESKRMAEREFRKVARLGVEGTSREISRTLRGQHQMAMTPEREVLESVRIRGGIKFPGGMTKEEWRNALPRALRFNKRAGAGVGVDELAQEFADAGLIRDAYQDTLLDYLNRIYAEVRSRPPEPAARDLRKAAMKIVDDRARRAAREVADMSRYQGELACSGQRETNPCGGRMRLKKGSPEAREHMARLRAMAGGRRGKNPKYDEANRKVCPACGVARLWPGDKGVCSICSLNSRIGAGEFRGMPRMKKCRHCRIASDVLPDGSCRSCGQGGRRGRNPAQMLVLGNPSSGPADENAARELELFIENDADLYRQQWTPIVRNLMIKRAKGTYDRNKAVKLFMYLMESGAKKYLKEYGTPGAPIDTVFNKNTRLTVAVRFRDSFEVEADLGNYNNSTFLPKKYLKNPLTHQEHQALLSESKRDAGAGAKMRRDGRPDLANYYQGRADANFGTAYHHYQPATDLPTSYEQGRRRPNAPRTGTMKALISMAAEKGLSIDTWHPGDGVTRYRFFPFPNGDYYAHSHQAVGTVKGLKAAFKFVENYGRQPNPGRGRGATNEYGIPAHIWRDPQFQRELRAFKRRHGNVPMEIMQVDTPAGSPKYMSAWGHMPEVKYDTASTWSNKGRRVHTFGEGRRGRGRKPFLVSSSERGGKYLQIVGGNFQAGGEWIRH